MCLQTISFEASILFMVTQLVGYIPWHFPCINEQEPFFTLDKREKHHYWVLAFCFICLFSLPQGSKAENSQERRTATGFAFIKEAVIQNYPVMRPISAVW